MKRQKFNMVNKTTIMLFVLMLGMLAVFSVRAAETKKGDVARGIQAWSQNCMRCHNARDPREYSDNLWKPVITHMRIRAGLTGQQARDILEYFKQSN